MALRNEDYSDRELLHLLKQVSTGGIVSLDDIAAGLGIERNNSKGKNGGPTPRQRVSSRMNWMASFGFVVKLDPSTVGRPRTPALYALTHVGEELMNGRLTRQVERFLEDSGAGDRLLAMRQLTQAGYVDARPEAAVALRREWQYSMARRAK